MRLQAYKISGGRGVLKNALATGPRIAVRGRPPSPKTFKIWIGYSDRGSSASLTGMFKKSLVADGSAGAPGLRASHSYLRASASV